MALMEEDGLETRRWMRLPSDNMLKGRRRSNLRLLIDARERMRLPLPPTPRAFCPSSYTLSVYVEIFFTCSHYRTHHTEPRLHFLSDERQGQVCGFSLHPKETTDLFCQDRTCTYRCKGQAYYPMHHRGQQHLLHFFTAQNIIITL